MNRSQRERRFITIVSLLLLLELVSGIVLGNIILTLGFLCGIMILCGFRWREIKMERITDHVVGEVK